MKTYSTNQCTGGWLCPKILGVRQQGTQGVADRLQQQRRHHRDGGQSQRVELMGQGKDDMVMITGQESGPLEGQPALGLEVGTLRTRPMPTRVVPDARHMAVRTGLRMAAQRRSPTLHNSPCSAPDMGRQRMALLVGGIRVLKDALERHESHQGLPQRIGWVWRGVFSTRLSAP